MTNFARNMKKLERSSRNTRIISEMPYVNYSKSDPDKLFDFEFEIYSTPSEFFKHLKKLLDGGVHSDKYGNEIGPIKSRQEREEIVQQILDDKLGMVYSIANNKWKIDREDFTLLMKTFLENLD